MKPLFKEKLENTHNNLMEAFKESSNYPPVISGAEREIVQRNLLSLILPPGHRIGTGTIIDQNGGDCGQVDAVIEQPFSVSFPVVSDNNRLYLASTVCAAFEIKSDLNAQKDQAVEKISSVKRLCRRDCKPGEIVSYDEMLIPSFVIGYKGPKTHETIENHYFTPLSTLNPTGVLIIESELFYGRSANGKWHSASGKAECILAFLSCLIESIEFASSQPVSLYDYKSQLTP